MRKILRPTPKTPFALPETQPIPIPAPVGGWNAIDPLANMDPKYAPILINWVPRTSWIELRAGYNAWAQGLTTGPVETLMAYKPNTGTQFLFAAAGGNFYNVSNQGTPSVVRSGFGNNRWQYLNFSVPGGSQYLYAVNGSDNPQLWDGTSWTTPTITGGPAQTTFFNIHAHQNRLWLIPNNSTKIYYLGTNAITGAIAGSLDLGALMTQGGFIIAMGTWTYNGGTGPQNLAVFVSSRGQVIIYSGNDPTNASTWSLVGVFDLPPPLGVRCLAQIGSDVGIITLQGVLPLSKTIQLDTGAVREAAITGRIQNAMLQAAAAYQNNFGWQLISYPAQGLLFLNVPQQTNVAQVQYVQNFLNGAWTQFNGWNANCFEIFNDQLYFGGNNGLVAFAYQGPADLVSPIVADMQCAFNYFGAPGRSKRMSMIQPLLVTGGTITPTLGVDVDFGTSTLTTPVSSFKTTGAIYDTSLYDQSFYAQGPLPQSLWQSVLAEGHALAVRMKVNVLSAGSNQQSVFDTGTFDAMVFDGYSGQSASILQINAFNAVVEMGNFI